MFQLLDYDAVRGDLKRQNMTVFNIQILLSTITTQCTHLSRELGLLPQST